jgi:hypothetical protein
MRVFAQIGRPAGFHHGLGCVGAGDGDTGIGDGVFRPGYVDNGPVAEGLIFYINVI